MEEISHHVRVAGRFGEKKEIVHDKTGVGHQREQAVFRGGFGCRPDLAGAIRLLQFIAVVSNQGAHQPYQALAMHGRRFLLRPRGSRGQQDGGG